MRLLGLGGAEDLSQRYPHEVSGNQLQRMMTAMELCSEPDLIVFDKPTTALNTQTQTQVLAVIRHALTATRTAVL